MMCQVVCRIQDLAQILVERPTNDGADGIVAHVKLLVFRFLALATSYHGCSDSPVRR